MAKEDKTPSGTEVLEVSNTINLNVNQNDLIEVLIEDKKQEIESVLDGKKKRYTEIQEEIKEVDEKVKKYLLSINKNAKLDKVVKALAAVGVEVNLSVSIDMQDKGDPYRESKRVDIEKIGHYKDPIRSITNATYTRRDFLVKYVGYHIDTLSKDPEITINTRGASQSMPINATVSKFQDARTALCKEGIDLTIEINRLEVVLLKLDYGEKRVKAQFIKASLGKSKEGATILSLLEQVKKGTKLLG